MRRLTLALTALAALASMAATTETSHMLGRQSQNEGILVLPKKGEHVVFVVEDGRAVRRSVTIERIVGQEALLSAGLGVGDVVVTEGHRALQDGSLVSVQG